MANINTTVINGVRTDWVSFDTLDVSAETPLWNHLRDIEATEKIVYTKGNTPLGFATRLNEGDPIPFATPVETPTLTLTQMRDALKIGFTFEEQTFDLYNKVPELAKEMVTSIAVTKEKNAQNLALNNAFNSAFAIATGAAAYSDSHTIAGSTLDNLYSASALSESVLEAMFTQLRKQKAAGPGAMPMAFTGKSLLLVPPALMLTASKIQNSTNRLESSDNDANVVRGLFEIMECVHATSDTAFALIPADKSKHWMRKAEKVKIQSIVDNDSDGNLTMAKVSVYDIGTELPYNTIGNPGQ